MLSANRAMDFILVWKSGGKMCIGENWVTLQLNLGPWIYNGSANFNQAFMSHPISIVSG